LSFCLARIVRLWRRDDERMSTVANEVRRCSMWARLMERLGRIGGRSARRGRLGIVSWSISGDADAQALTQRLRADRARYHLGRARRARDAGQHPAGAVEARRALALTPANPWALAVLGQCLMRQDTPDLAAARRATEQAWALDPTNGYFVRLLLEVLDAQGDVVARAELLDWAWWKGAPVERWLPGGVPAMAAADRPTPGARDESTLPVEPNRATAGPTRAAVPA